MRAIASGLRLSWFRFGMGLLGEDQPDPDGSSGSQAIKSVVDHLGGLRVHAPDLSELGSHSLELSEAGNLRSLQRFPGAYGQEQSVEGIIQVLRQGSGHWHASWLLNRK
ncbi:hypothetical protein BB934_33205 (plasmid) [Microvirga ossetica]|uniref:Uncharacterized protein n=1 Tax=Microvirga ossetica TaxID=1882682 RepID=A0A1B2ESY2_9HYPH|nr:hypothetical protein [Microvirga ossetica]ANY83067.1 hypothetical protein BB934_33205 [Microvirga ossetica]